MYNADLFPQKKGRPLGFGRKHTDLVQERIDKWFATIPDPTQYRYDTIDEESQYREIYSILNNKDNIIFFRKKTPLSRTKKTDITNKGDFRKFYKTEITFLINGSDIPTRVEAAALLQPMSSYSLNVRLSAQGWQMWYRTNRWSLNETGTHAGKRLLFVKGQTLVHIPTHKEQEEEFLYIQEDTSFTRNTPLRPCPKRPNLNHNFTQWLKHGKTAYQTCRNCEETWFKAANRPYWEKLNHPIWNIMRHVKGGRIDKTFFLALPGVEIHTDANRTTWYFPQQPYLHGKWEMTQQYGNEHLIPSYPAKKGDIVP